MRLPTLLLLAVFLFPSLSAAQNLNDKYLSALDNWHDGHYPQALESFQDILSSNHADKYLERIALQTGELYKVSEISEDGTNIRFDDSGKYALYERTEEGVKFTYLVDADSGNQIAKIRGNSLNVLNNGSISLLQLADNKTIREAKKTRDKKIEQAYATMDRDLFFGAQREYAGIALENTKLMFMKDAKAKVSDITPKNLLVGELASPGVSEKIYFVGQKKKAEYSDVFSIDTGNKNLTNITKSANFETGINFINNGSLMLFNFASRNSLAPGLEVEAEISGKVGVMDLNSGEVHQLSGELAATGSTKKGILLLRKEGDEKTLVTVDAGNGFAEHVAITTTDDIRDPVFSPSGKKIAYSIKEQDDFEVYVQDIDGSNRTRVSHEIQHDQFPTFLSETTIIAAKGEGRHRRSFMYDIETGEVTKLFHNNTIRTIAPEYEWAVSPGGDKILIVSERDGNTISPERGVYLLDLTSKISKSELVARIDTQLKNERALRAKGKKLYAPIAEQVTTITDQASRNRVYTYENELYKFDSKYISQPGNDKASQYLLDTFTSFGYSPNMQWFTPPGQNVHNGKTANVLATLPGTVNPELVYVVSSHYDSVEDGPGADDNSSGTAALLEAARILADHPMPATIIFAAFTGEEAGLLGSREFVRQAQEGGMKIVGALNNDMLGFANDSHLDNTIRYSNPGIRDIQHAAAFLFSDMVTYDALYYKFTDAHAYYEAYGDIVGGIGSYPVLGNPFYHQWNDNLETINHQLVTEVAKTTAATLMLLASSPSRIKDLAAKKQGAKYTISWTPSPENGITGYKIEYTDKSGNLKSDDVAGTPVSLQGIRSGSEIRVKAVNSEGFEGWDWARVTAE
jgi:Tol biopolymer transport system component